MICVTFSLFPTGYILILSLLYKKKTVILKMLKCVTSTWVRQLVNEWVSVWVSDVHVRVFASASSWPWCCNQLLLLLLVGAKCSTYSARNWNSLARDIIGIVLLWSTPELKFKFIMKIKHKKNMNLKHQ